MGHLKPGQTSLMRMNALKRHDVDVVEFNARAILETQTWLERRLVSSIERGSSVERLNRLLLEKARTTRPNVIWFDKQELIRPSTTKELKKLGARLVFYTPDPYFAQPWKQTRMMTASMHMFDAFVTPKSYELAQYEVFGGDVIYMPLGFCDQMHRPMQVSENDYIDVGFIGSWEPRRQEFMTEIAEQGHSIGIWGYGWDHLLDGRWSIRRAARLRRMNNGMPVKIKRSDVLAGMIVANEIYADAYAQALSRSKLSLGLLRSTLYPDQHTTRTFEIPACGSMLLAERTAEHESFFEAGVEADFFADDSEMLDKVDYYSRNPTVRDKIAARGRERCLQSGYSYFERFRSVLSKLELN